jgi:hypothetical protein
MICCGIASLPGRELCLRKTIDSIYNQVDLVFVGLNNYPQTPLWFDYYDNLCYEHSDNSLGDGIKFRGVEYTNGYYLTLDDDLMVNNQYVEGIIEGINKYGVVSHHGKRYSPPITSYKKWDANYRCLDEVTEDQPINLLGSGCMGFKTSEFKVDIDRFLLPNMADVWISLLAYEQGHKPMVLKHRKGHINYLYPPDRTIWQNTSDYSEHIKIMQKFIK